jgi:sugar phosphate isomerase/epimerase
MTHSKLTDTHFLPVLHSVSYSGSWGQAFLPLDDFIDRAADLGYRGVLLMAKRPHLSVLDYGPKERLRLRAHLERRNLEIVYVAAYTNFTADLEHRDIPQIEIEIQYVTELASLA